jgi:predicted metalloprotease with PDZ domain
MSPAIPPVCYRVRVLPAEHELEVEMTLDGPAVAGGTVRLAVPTWVPGDYEFQPYGRDLFDFQAQDLATGARLEVAREGWQAFSIQGRQGPIRLRYRASAYEADFSSQCGIVDGECAVLPGTRYLRVPAWPGACRVAYRLPRGWKVHQPSGATRIGRTTWDYPSYEILLDTPVVLGRFDLRRRKVRGTPFAFVFVDRAPGYAAGVPSLMKGLARVAEECREVFGSFPFEDYTFLLPLGPGETCEWGLEHLSSSMCGLGPEAFINPEKTALAHRVCAHELFHAWNVRRLRPAPLGQLDLCHGCFTEGLWVAEGFTRYYEFLLCTRAGVYTPQQFFSAVVQYHEHLTVLPAYQRVSAVDASLATYLNHQKKYPGRCNNAIDYYDKGMLIAFELDAELRLRGRGDSLDAAFRDFYQQYQGSKLGYTTADVLAFFDGRQPGLGAMLSRQAEHPGGLTVVEHLERLGFQVKKESVPYLGLLFRDKEGKPKGPTIDDVLDTSPAGRCGITPGDVLAEVNGFPFTMKTLRWAAGRPDPVKLEVTRAARGLTFTVTPGRRTISGSLQWAGTAAQAQLVGTWLKQAFQPAPGQSFPLDFYENPHGIETVL